MRKDALRTIAVWVAMAGLHLALADIGLAGNWPGWRGPGGCGQTDEKDLPLTWDGKSGENVVWKAPLTGNTGHSSPIVWGDRVFLTTALKQTNQQEQNKEVPEHHLNCYAAADGQLLWRTPIQPGTNPAGYAIYAVPTPVTDGKVVYAWFGSAAIVAVDFDGKVLWRKDRQGPFKLNPGICSSPILYGDTVILLCDQGRGEGLLQGLDKKTGEVKWEQKRDKMNYNNSTPLLIRVAGKDQLVTASNFLQGAEPATGEPIWWCKSRSFGASPVFSAGLVYIDKGGNEWAMAVDPAGKGDVSETHLKWKVDKAPGEYSSPVVVGEHIYRAVKPEGVLCRKLADGLEVYNRPLKDLSYLASPFATPDGRIYFASAALTYVIKAGPEPELLATNKLGGGRNGSSAAVSDGRIYLRGSDALYCVGKK